MRVFVCLSSHLILNLFFFTSFYIIVRVDAEAASPKMEAGREKNWKRKGGKESRHQLKQRRALYLRRLVCGTQMSVGARSAGLMAQSAQVNYSLSWEEVQTERIASAQIVERSLRVS